MNQRLKGSKGNDLRFKVVMILQSEENQTFYLPLYWQLWFPSRSLSFHYIAYISTSTEFPLAVGETHRAAANANVCPLITGCCRPNFPHFFIYQRGNVGIFLSEAAFVAIL